jgi:quercetin dioxygenase-like cupin family protein
VPHWTKRNFDDLEDRSPAEVPMRWCFSRNAIHSSQVGVSRFTYEPGARMPFGHRHREQEEVYVVVSGSGRAKLDDELIELTQWDVLRVAPPVIRAFEAGPDGLEVICVGGRRPNGGDTERFEDFCRQTHPRGERLARPTLTPQSKNSSREHPAQAEAGGSQRSIDTLPARPVREPAEQPPETPASIRYRERRCPFGSPTGTCGPPRLVRMFSPSMRPPARVRRAQSHGRRPAAEWVRTARRPAGQR